MQNGMKLIEKINEITANSVTPEEFKKATGYSIDEHVANMMDRIHRLEGKNRKVVKISVKAEGRPAARLAAKSAAAAKLEKEVTGRVTKALKAAGLALPGIERIKLVEGPRKGKLAGQKATKGLKRSKGGGGPIGGGPK